MTASQSGPETVPLGDLDKGQEIRIALAAYFKGRATGKQLRAAVSFGDKRSTFYDALGRELRAGNIRAIGGRYPIYELGPNSPAARSPDDPPDSDSRTPEQGQSLSNPNPHKTLREGGPDSNSPPVVRLRGTRGRSPVESDAEISAIFARDESVNSIARAEAAQ